MLILGLTGGIACGKSTVSNRLREEHHLDVIDADIVAREVVEPGTTGYNKIVGHFSPLIPELLNTDGTLNRRALGAYVFQHKEDLAKLNSIVHPAVRWAMVKKTLWAYVTGKKVVVLDVPLLFESKLDQFCGITLLVSCSRETQLRRLLKRDPDLSLEDAENRIRNQMPTELKAEKADVVLNNEKTLQDLYTEIDGIVEDVTPSLAKNLLMLVPPIGLLVAVWIYALKKFKESYTAKATKKHR